MPIAPRVLLACVMCMGAGACANASPAAPSQVLIATPLSPINGAVVDNGCFDFSNQSVQDYDWTDVPNATAYNLYVIGPTAAIPTVNLSTITGSEYRDSDTGWTGSVVGWRWRVRALVGGVWRDWSSDGIFNFEPPNTDCPPMKAS